MIINPIVKGSFKNLVLIKAKVAESMIRIVMILKMPMDRNVRFFVKYNQFMNALCAGIIKVKMKPRVEKFHALLKSRSYWEKFCYAFLSFPFHILPPVMLFFKSQNFTDFSV